MHEVEIKIVHAARFELHLKERADVRLRLEAGIGELISEDEALPRVAFGNCLADGGLTLPADVDMRRVKVVKTVLHESVGHPLELLDVHLSVLHGQAHTAEAEILFYFRKECIAHSYHRPFLKYILLYHTLSQKSICFANKSDRFC